MEFIVDGSGKKRKAVRVICKYCENSFLKAERFINKVPHYCCREHFSLDHRTRKVVECSYCGKEFEKRLSSFIKSKSGFCFCSRKCQSEAQKIGSGFHKMYPSHYGTGNGKHGYRKKAIDYYNGRCENCGYDEYEECLQVHHIDRNRENNEIENLIVLCANCHSLLTFGHAILENRKVVWKVNRISTFSSVW